VAFFSLLLLLFFDVIHVANDDLHPSGPISPRYYPPHKSNNNQFFKK
jgi:hypothetical protein